MRGRRRILLLAVIIVAVAIGAVGITIVSLFAADVGEKRETLVVRLDEMAAGHALERQTATLSRDASGWQIAGGDVPPLLLAELPATPPAGNEVIWLDSVQYLAALRATGRQEVLIAWYPLADIRAPFQRAALYAGSGLVLLLAIGIALFYRTTAPLLRSIERSEARYRTLFANTADGVVLLGDGIEECNDRFCEMFACRREEAVGLAWRDFFRNRRMGSEQDLTVLDSLVEQAMRGENQPFTWTFRLPDGQPLAVDVVMRVLSEQSSQQRPRALVSLRDVTAREHSGRMLREAEAVLRESRDKLAQAGRSSALVELAGGIAHEINQPLAAIANYARAGRRIVVSGKAGEDDLVRTLDRIAEQAQRAGSAIHRIRALVSPAEAPSAHLTAPVCMNRLIAEVVELMGEEIARHGARIELAGGNDVAVVADPLQIQQVVMQLLRNALEAIAAVSPADRVVHVLTRRTGKYVEVEVEDRGPGMSADDRARMFEPFYSTKERGMGMGLPISMSIIRSHHGDLAVDEACERGTRFRFRLPAGPHATDARVEDGKATV